MYVDGSMSSPFNAGDWELAVLLDHVCVGVCFACGDFSQAVGEARHARASSAEQPDESPGCGHGRDRPVLFSARHGGEVIVGVRLVLLSGEPAGCHAPVFFFLHSTRLSIPCGHGLL